MGRHKRAARAVNDTLPKNILNILNSGDGYDVNISRLEDVGISRFTIRSWLQGVRTPQVATLRSAAKALGVDYLDFFSRDRGVN